MQAAKYFYIWHLQIFLHVHSVNLLSSVEIGMPMADLPILEFSGKSQSSWALSTGPTTRSLVLMPPTWSLFLTVWSEKCTPLAC